ncbi:hypothetical protein CU044_2172 [Streptomyces sp. L-9-10]|nr:hypothetical protein CU044_2172 [Streptomyces sp. L-9-10]
MPPPRACARALPSRVPAPDPGREGGPGGTTVARVEAPS